MTVDQMIAAIDRAKNELGHVGNDMRDVATGDLKLHEVNIAYIDSVIQRLSRIKDAVNVATMEQA